MKPIADGYDNQGPVRPFGRMPDGVAVSEYTLTNGAGLRATILDYGGIITGLQVPDRDGAVADVVLGFDNLDAYIRRHPYFGAVVGRYAGRIAGGQFAIDGKTVNLSINSGSNHLHGGIDGFDRVVWKVAERSPGILVLSHVSPDGDQGYPGTLTARVTYTMTGNGLRVEYAATSDAPTVINLTQHSYFNLSGFQDSDVLGHELEIMADEILELDQHSIPTGRRLPVDGSPFDFREPKRIGRDLRGDDPQLVMARGYDHTWVLAPEGGKPAVVLSHPASGRRLEVWTTEPGVQVYTGNYLDGSITGKAGVVYGPHAGIALETQHFPDSPNHPAFPNTLLRPGEDYRSATEFRFSVSADPGALK